MAAVYEAEHVNIGKRVAIKVLSAELASSAVVIERFFREARAAASVKSPHIVEVYDSGRLEDGRPFIAMELLEGESLYDRMATRSAVRAQHDGAHHQPSREGPDEGARGRHRPPRSQARKHPPVPRRGRRRNRQDPRLRPRQVLLAGQDRREDGALDARGGSLRDARLHVPRAGEGARQRRSASRSLGARVHGLRMPHGATGLEHRSGRRHDVCRDRCVAASHAEPAAARLAAPVRCVVPQGARAQPGQTLSDGPRARRRARESARDADPPHLAGEFEHPESERARCRRGATRARLWAPASGAAPPLRRARRIPA